MKWIFRQDAPIYTQVMDQFRLAIVSGELAPGERLRAVRELAAEAGVNPNTMQRALSELERQNLAYSQRTSGRFVTEDLNVIAALKRELAEKKLRDFLGGMETLGYSREDIVKLIEESEDTEHGDPGM